MTPEAGRGVSPRLNSLESLFAKEGLREFGAKGVRRNLDAPELCPGFPLPRIREDRPRGNDPPEADRKSGDAHVS
jgi:hypothetical protein